MGTSSSILQSNAPESGNGKCKGPREWVESENEWGGGVIRDEVMSEYSTEPWGHHEDSDGWPRVASGERKVIVRHTWVQGHHGQSLGNSLKQSCCSASGHWNWHVFLHIFIALGIKEATVQQGGQLGGYSSHPGEGADGSDQGGGSKSGEKCLNSRYMWRIALCYCLKTVSDLYWKYDFISMTSIKVIIFHSKEVRRLVRPVDSSLWCFIPNSSLCFSHMHPHQLFFLSP